MRAAGAALLREPRRGYGYPCMTGARAAAAAGARAVVFMEADGTDDPAQCRYLVAPVLAGVADLVIGLRRRAVRGASLGRMPLHQRLGNDWLALSLWLFFGLRLSDDGPYRAVRLDLLESLRSRGARLRLPHRDGGEGAPRRCAHRHPRRPLSHPQRGRPRSPGRGRGSAAAVRDIFWCLLRLGLFGFRPRAGQ